MYQNSTLMGLNQLIIASIGSLIIAGCASIPAVPCPPGEEQIVLDSLYFGTAKPGRAVTAEEWTAFLNEMVASDFLEGLTSWSAAGRWRNSAGALEQETSYVLQLAHEGSEEKNLAVQQIVQRYKSSFQQDAVMRIRSQACRSF